ncbi:MAG: CDP-alcohol phosphatidyltransferase family protein [Rhodanobacteraceae bacterium]|nr:CDP-alcohol phosphatidyltransferase family protein [Rhodanobacteraceae bacterium]
MSEPSATDARRPLTSRNTAWAHWIARRLAATEVTPNQISLASIGFALVGGLLLLRPDWPVAMVFAAICIQLRLLCNLIDGMVAVEGGKGTPVGALYNEVPDRVADSLFLIGAGYGVGLPELGWFAALVAALTAYIRVLGGSLGLKQDFRGPQAKPQRMFVLTLGCLAVAWEGVQYGSWHSLSAALWIIAVGSLLTAALRIRAIARELQA